MILQCGTLNLTLVSFSNMFTVPTVAFAISFFVLYFVARRRLHKRPPYPPGPTPSLIIGNLLDTPLTEAWLTYIKWGSLYGIYLPVMKIVESLTLSVLQAISFISLYSAHTLSSLIHLITSERCLRRGQTCTRTDPTWQQ